MFALRAARFQRRQNYRSDFLSVLSRFPPIPPSQHRGLHIHKLQFQDLLKQACIPVANGALANTPKTTENAQHEAAGQYGEYHLTITLDREKRALAIILSKQDANSIPAVVNLDYQQGITTEAMSQLTTHLPLTQTATTNLQTLLQNLYTFFTRIDATHLEITKLLHTAQDTFVCHDTSALTIDDAAAPRQPDLASLRDKTTKSPAQREAEKQGLVYVRLNDGDVGTVVNGAGLAMATNDAIAFYGGRSANFLDAGGQATTETMVKAFEIVLGDERVRVVLVNIYGGIIRCDMVAESIIQAAARLGPLRCPMVVRLQGTNSEEGQRMIQESGLDLIAESDFGRAAQVAVEQARLV